MLKISKFIPFFILINVIFTFRPYVELKISNTFFWWSVNAITLIILSIYIKKGYKPLKDEPLFWVKSYLIWMLLSIIHGIFIAETYWDWKGLVGNTFGLLLPGIIFAAVNIKIPQQILSVYIKVAIPLLLIISPILGLRGLVFSFYGLTFFLLFYPLIPNPFKIIILLLSIVTIIIDVTVRAYFIKISFAFLLSFLYYFRFFISKRVLNLLKLSFFLIPFVFFSLAVFTSYNILDTDDEITVKKEVEKGEIKNENLLVDTRSGLYEEVLDTADKYNTWLFGRSPARGNETRMFAKLKKNTGRKERLGNEVGVLNIFMWTGTIGVVLYFMMLFKASTIAIKRSNNIWAKILGLYIAFRWIVFWVEDIPNFTLNHFVLMLMIGLAYSSWFRKMTNKEVEIWIKGIFYKKYRIIDEKYSGINNLS